MNPFILSPQAVSDVEDLTDYYASRSRKFAAKLAVALRRTFRVVARNPRVGKPAPHGPAGLRQFAVAKHLVFFRDTPTGVEIVRVLDGRRLIDDTMFDTP